MSLESTSSSSSNSGSLTSWSDANKSASAASLPEYPAGDPNTEGSISKGRFQSFVSKLLKKEGSSSEPVVEEKPPVKLKQKKVIKQSSSKVTGRPRFSTGLDPSASIDTFFALKEAKEAAKVQRQAEKAEREARIAQEERLNPDELTVDEIKNYTSVEDILLLKEFIDSRNALLREQFSDPVGDEFKKGEEKTNFFIAKMQVYNQKKKAANEALVNAKRLAAQEALIKKRLAAKESLVNARRLPAAL